MLYDTYRIGGEAVPFHTRTTSSDVLPRRMAAHLACQASELHSSRGHSSLRGHG